MIDIKEVTRDDAIYIAGLFDGEGCISLHKASRLQEKGKTPTYVLRARVRMTDMATIQWLYATIGGRYYGQRKNSKPNARPYYEWGVAGKNAIDFLNKYIHILRLRDYSVRRLLSMEILIGRVGQFFQIIL